MKNLLAFATWEPTVRRALQTGQPVVALESTVLTHGLPYPQNLELAADMEDAVRETGAVPATIAVLEGKIHIGLSPQDRERLVAAEGVRKISRRDFAPALAFGQSGGTTVAGTMIVAAAAGIRVFATGGIGGVHRYPPYDVSTDLTELARTPVIVVCAGAKAILDLPATLEVLETWGVPVIGYQTDEFPAFYSRESGLPLSVRADTPGEVVRLARTHWQLGMESGVLVAVPPPVEDALPRQQVEDALTTALREVEEKNIRGQASTPYLLSRLSELTGGATLRANLALLLENARVAAAIARQWTGETRKFV